MPKVRILRQGVEEADAGGGCLVRARRQGLVAEYVEVIEAAVDVIEDGSRPFSPVPGGPVAKEQNVSFFQFPYDIVVVGRGDERMVVAFVQHSRKLPIGKIVPNKG